MQIRFDRVGYIYRSPLRPPKEALRDITLTIGEGEIVAVVGESGSGKSTLVQLMNGLLSPTSGRIWVDGEDIHLPGYDRNELRRRIGLVFQFPETQLFEETVFEEVAFAPKQLGLSEEEITQRVREALSWVGLDFDTFRRRSPFHLSGGEKRRVALAGILALNPEVLVLDEPTAGLDGSGTRQVTAFIRDFHATGRTVVFVSHHMDFVSRLADRAVVLHCGRLLYDGSVRRLFREPDLLDRAGLRLPQIPAFMHRLVQKGFPVPTDCLTLEEAIEALHRLARSPQIQRNGAKGFHRLSGGPNAEERLHD